MHKVFDLRGRWSYGLKSVGLTPAVLSARFSRCPGAPKERIDGQSAGSTRPRHP